MASDEDEDAYAGVPNITAFLDEWMREKSLLLKAKSWRVFVDNATCEAPDVSSIEFVCTCVRGWTTEPIHIGSLREPLEEIPVTVTIRRGTPPLIEALRADNARRKVEGADDNRKRQEFVGLAQYWEPQNSGDGVVSDKHGSLNGWFALGPSSFDYMRSILTRSDVPDFAIGLTLRFPAEDREWDGKGQIDVVSGRIVLSTENEEVGYADNEPVEAKSDPAAIQLATTKDVAVKVERLRMMLFGVTATIIAAIAIFR